jgi:uncharacterized protein YdeI (YjbR/CyaY-like superfamily)
VQWAAAFRPEVGLSCVRETVLPGRRAVSQRTPKVVCEVLRFAQDDIRENSYMEIVFFPTPRDLQKWFRRNHATEQELWVGFYKKNSGKPSVTWPESVDEALCVGWIDGIRKSIDAESYMIRFTPRRRGSIWSAVNIKRVKVLTKEKRMQPPGLAAFAARREYKSGIYSYEQRGEHLPEPYAGLLRRNKKAWEFFEAQPPFYRKMIGWWVVSAKQEKTRRKRLQKLIAESAAGHRL